MFVDVAGHHVNTGETGQGLADVGVAVVVKALAHAGEAYFAVEFFSRGVAHKHIAVEMGGVAQLATHGGGIGVVLNDFGRHPDCRAAQIPIGN